MLRLLGILLPALFGAAMVWYLVPTGDVGRAGADAGRSGRPELTEEEKRAFAVVLNTLMSNPRALLGKDLEIITPDTEYSIEDLETADAKFLGRAYQECQLLLRPELRREYLESIGEADEEGAQSQPDGAQMSSCTAVIRVLNGMGRDES